MFDSLLSVLNPEELLLDTIEGLVSNDATNFDDIFIEELRKEGVSLEGLALASLKALASQTDSKVDDTLLALVTPVIRTAL